MQVPRKFVDDGYELADAVKNGDGRTLHSRFQQYWMKRCNNDRPLSKLETYGVLTQYMIDNFDRADWQLLRDLTSRFFSQDPERVIMSLMEGIAIMLTVIDSMKMVEEADSE